MGRRPLLSPLEASLTQSASNGPGTIAPSTRAIAMLEHPTLAVAVTERGRILESNAPWRALFALPGDVSVESHVAALFANVHAADRFERLLKQQLTGVGSSAVAEQTLVRRDGASFLAEVVFWLFDSDGVDGPLAANAIWQVRDITVERALRRELRDLEDYYRELSRHQWDMTFVVDRKGRISYASPSVEGALGHRIHALLGEPFTSLLDPKHASAAGRWLRSVAGKQGHPHPECDGYRLHVLDREGAPHVLACRPRNCFDIARISGMVVYARDVTDVIAEEERAAASIARARALRDALLALAREPSAPADRRVVALLDAARERLDARVAIHRSHDGDPREVVSPPDAGSIPPRLGAADDCGWHAVNDVQAAEVTDAALRDAFQAAKIAAAVEAPVLSGGRLLGRLLVAADSPRRWSEGDIDFVIGIGQLIASALSSPDPAVQEAQSGPPPDPLTGLPDRGAAQQWLERRVASLGRSGSLTMLSIDLDRLQDVNDRYGHAAGDAVIVRTARALESVIGGGGYVARVGGDAFIVVLTNAGQKAIDETMAILLDRIGAASDDAGAPRVGASIGIARLPGDASDAAALWLHADLAMREAKQRGRGQASLFSPRLAAAVRAQKALDVEIAAALARDEFVLFYQPQISLSTGAVVGLEALLRWRHPTRGLLLPDVFIEAAVERGLIEPITKSVVHQVCEQLATWQRNDALRELPVGVNVAGYQFHDRRLPALVAAALMRGGLPARLLVLELNEQAIVGDEKDTDRVVKELSRLGVRTAVGGFGLGHGALKQLRQLRIAQIKLDRGFVHGLPHDEESDIVVTTVIEIARRLKCQVIAEGVETRDQFERLRALGCEAGQGYYFGPPLAPEDILPFIEQNRAAPVR